MAFKKNIRFKLSRWSGRWGAFRRRMARSVFFRTAFDSYVLRILQTLVGLAASILVARLLGPENQGFYAVAMVIASLGVQFGHLGIQWSNNYYVARDRKLLPSLVSNSLWSGLGLGMLLAGLLGAIWLIAPRFVPLKGLLLIMSLVWIPLSLIYLFMRFLLVGIQRIPFNNRVELAGRGLKVIFMMMLWAVGWVTVESFFGVALLSLFLSLLATYIFLRREAGRKPRPSWTLFRSHLGYGFRAYLSTFLSFLVLKVDQLMVQYQAGMTQTGYYATAVSIGDAIYLFPGVICSILFPKLAGLGSVSEKFILTKKVVGLTGLFMLPLLLVVASCAGFAVPLVFGNRYLSSVSPLLWLLPGLYFLALQDVSARFLYSIEFPKGIILAWLAAVLLNVGLNLWMIPRWGINGAAIASSISYLFILLLTVWLIWRVVRKHP